jgi:hypothetical protein
MQDPKPANITGEKRFHHTLKWEINVAHTILGLLALFLAWKLFGSLRSSSDEDQDAPLTGEEEISVTMG